MFRNPDAGPSRPASSVFLTSLPAERAPASPIAEMEDLDNANRPDVPLSTQAGAAAGTGARELLLAGGFRLPHPDAVTTVRTAAGLPVVACGGGVPGLGLARMLLEAGAARIAVHLGDSAAEERMRLLAEVFGGARTDALLVLRIRLPRDPGLAASFGLAPRWEAVVPSSDDDASGTTGIGADPVALARVAREAGAGRILVQPVGTGTPTPALVAALAEASGLPVLLVEPARQAASLFGVRAAGPRPLPSSAA